MKNTIFPLIVGASASLFILSGCFEDSRVSGTIVTTNTVEGLVKSSPNNPGLPSRVYLIDSVSPQQVVDSAVVADNGTFKFSVQALTKDSGTYSIQIRDSLGLNGAIRQGFANDKGVYTLLHLKKCASHDSCAVAQLGNISLNPFVSVNIKPLDTSVAIYAFGHRLSVGTNAAIQLPTLPLDSNLIVSRSGSTIKNLSVGFVGGAVKIDSSMATVDQTTLPVVFDNNAQFSYHRLFVGNREWLLEPSRSSVTLFQGVCADSSQNQCANLGLYYSGTTALAGLDSNGEVCPQGYQVPTTNDLNQLLNAVGGFASAGQFLRSATWPKHPQVQTTIGFNWSPDGWIDSLGRSQGLGQWGSFWVAPTVTSQQLQLAYLTDTSDSVVLVSRDTGYKTQIRCVKNNRVPLAP